MLEGFPWSVRVNPVINLSVVWKVQVTESLHGTEGGGLGAEVRAADEHRMHAVADCGVDALQIPEGNFALTIEDFVDVVLAAAGGHVPFRNVAYALGMFQGWRRDERDIAERGSSKAANHPAARRPSLLRRARQVV